jgi:plastocyanin domain-containing protein
MMLKKVTFFATLAGFGFLLGAISGAIAAEMPEMAPTSSMGQTEKEFERIEQPLENKAAITLGGLGFIGLELWWFLFSKPQTHRAKTQAGIQEISITVDGGYEPSQIIVQVGQPVRLKFDRRDPSSCLDEVRFPDFQIVRALPLNQVTAIEFTPSQPGTYNFACGMNMFRGTVKVEAAQQKVSHSVVDVPA